jgi:hypothetical protein
MSEEGMKILMEMGVGFGIAGIIGAVIALLYAL